MGAERTERVQRIFLAVRDAPEAERPALLGELCAGDEELRAEVESLLAYDGRQGLDAPASLEQLAASPGLPENIAGYRILERLGVGGMGVVYRAEQERPRRQVALKVIASAFPSQAAQQRFEEEIRILGGLEHPGIARIYAAGSWDGPGGPLPYFTMELVAGEPLTAYAERLRLTVEKRLRLLADVCDAVAFAHQHDVVHCDLKPSNVLVDASGRPRVLDFGVARLVAREPGRGAPEGTGGTPGFMSPEQWSGGPADPRWDVFALGVLGCVLLGAPPPGGSARAPVSVPSVGDPRLARDARAVLEKAIAAPPRRYAAANALALDLSRCAAFLPTSAASPGLVHRARLFRLREPWLAGLLLALAVGAPAAGTALAWQRQRAARAAEAVIDQTGKTRAALEYLRQVVLDPVRGASGESAAWLEHSADLADEALAQDPELLAHVRGLFGEAFEGRGRFEQAESNLTSAWELLSAERGPEAAETLQAALNLGTLWGLQGKIQEASDWLRETHGRARAALGPDHAVTLAAEHELGCALMAAGDLPGADAHLQRALDGRARSLQEDDLDLLMTRGMLGFLRSEQGRGQEAEPFLVAALEGMRRTLGEEHPLTLTSLNNLATLYGDLGRFEEALELAYEERTASERIRGPTHPSTLTSRNNVALLTGECGALEEAEALLSELAEECDRIMDPSHPTTLLVRHNLAYVLERQGRLPEAERAARLALEGRKQRLGPAHPHTLLTQELLDHVREREERGAAAGKTAQ
jgi:tetratricopeptide (TPR) repeat protein